MFRTRRGGLPPPLTPLRWTPRRAPCQKHELRQQNHVPEPLSQPEPAKTTYPIRVSPGVTLGSFEHRLVWVRGFGPTPRRQARIGSVLTVLRKSHEDGAPLSVRAPQIGSVLEVSSIVPEVLRKTYGTRRPRTANSLCLQGFG